MKKQSLQFIAMTLILGLSAIYISASPFSDTFRIEIPFDFQVGSKTYDAGTYSFKRVTQSQLVFENIESGKQRYVLGVLGSNLSGDYVEHKLRFHRYGDQHFLREITSPSSVFSLTKSKAEKRASKKTPIKEVILGS